MKQTIDKCRRQEHLDLHQQSMTDDEFDYLCSKAWCNKIKSLKLHSNNITWVGISSLCKADWSNLIKLQLANNKIRDKGCKYLSRTNMKLIQISLNGCEIGSAGILHLMKCKWNLSLFGLHYNVSIGQDFRALMKMANSQLEKIGINAAPSQNIVNLLLFEGKLSGFWIIEPYGGYKMEEVFKSKLTKLFTKRFEIDHLTI